MLPLLSCRPNAGCSHHVGLPTRSLNNNLVDMRS